MRSRWYWPNSLGLVVVVGLCAHCSGASDTLVGGRDASVDGKGSSSSGGSSGSSSGSGSGSSSGGGTCADPGTPAGCTACMTGGHTCAANGCYGGYLCDTATDKCKAPGACP